MLKKPMLLGVVGALGLLSALSAAAQGVSLDTLISSGDSVTVNGITYSNFSAKGSLAASEINVEVTSQGLSFSGDWDARRGKVAIGYSIAVDPASGNAIARGGLSLAPPEETGVRTRIKITDKYQDLSSKKHKKYQLKVNYDSARKALSNHLSSSVNFNPAVTSMKVVKNIDVSAGFGAFATLNFVDTTFALFTPAAAVAPVIPEPATLALLPLALAGLALRKKFLK